MICDQCLGEISYHGCIKISEINFDDTNYNHIFCSYDCLRVWYGWRRQ